MTDLKGLNIECSSDQTNIDNIIEKNTSWIKVINLDNINGIPDDYLDIVKFTNCDLETNFRKLKDIYKKLKIHGKIYFNNLYFSFDNILKKCLTPLEYSQFINDTFNAAILKSILADLFNYMGLDYHIAMVDINNIVYIVLIKGYYNFSLTNQQNKLLDEINKLVSEKIPDIKEKKQQNINEMLFENIIEFKRKGYKNIIKKLAEKDIDVENPKILNDILALDKFIDTIEKQIKEMLSLNLSEQEIKNKVSTIDILEQKFVDNWLDKIIKQNSKKILPTGLVNLGGYSCFMDSILFAILIDNDYFEKNLLNKELNLNDVKACSFFDDKQEQGLLYLQNFQNELKKLMKILRTERRKTLYCTPIKSKMQKCNELSLELMSGEQQDDSEFLRVLMNIFSLEPTVIQTTIYLSNDGKKWIEHNSVKTNESIIEIQLDNNITTDTNNILDLVQNIKITDYDLTSKLSWPKDSNNNRYRYMKEQTSILESKLLIIHIARKQLYKKSTKLVDFCEYIENKTDGQKYFLQAITIHYGTGDSGHYTAYVKYGTQWLYYDDTNPLDERVIPVTWEQAYTAGKKNGSLFIYSLI
jgi:ubiquitin C-terminal hydrolase